MTFAILTVVIDVVTVVLEIFNPMSEVELSLKKIAVESIFTALSGVLICGLLTAAVTHGLLRDNPDQEFLSVLGNLLKHLWLAWILVLLIISPIIGVQRARYFVRTGKKSIPERLLAVFGCRHES